MQSSGIPFVVVGGWVPFLFNSRPIRHPGPFDVDILVNDRTPRRLITKAIRGFRNAGYALSAKNAFQLHRLLTVRSDLVHFHVDFLHRRYADDATGLVREWGEIQSIATVGMDVIFLRHESRHEPVRFTLPDGSVTTLMVPFATEAGFLGAKGRSLHVEKRRRDAFDVFLIIRQSGDYKVLVRRCRELREDAMFDISLRNIRKTFDDGTFVSNVIDFLPEGGNRPEQRALVLHTMETFFSDVGVSA